MSVLTVILMGLAAATGSLWVTEHRTLVREVNAHRINAGLAPLVEAADLSDYATEHSWQMARTGQIWHSDLRHIPGLWGSAGEVVGRSTGPWRVIDAFMRSPDHRMVVLGDWREVGYGHIRSDGDVFVTVVFRK